MKAGSAKAGSSGSHRVAVKPVLPITTAKGSTRPATNGKAVAAKQPARSQPAGQSRTATPAARPVPVAVKAVKPVVEVKPVKPKLKAKSRPAIEVVPVRLPPPPVTSNSKMAKNKAGLSPKELEAFRDLLLQKRRELLGDMSSMEGEALRSGNTNLSNLPLHMADTGTDNYEQEFTLGLVEKDRKLLREIQAALAKIQDGSYGVCEGTGKPIGKPRLEAQPWAKYSIEHARALEKPQFRRAY